MMILRLLNVLGIAGIAVSLCLAVLLVMQKGETRKNESASYERLYRAKQAAFAQTVADYRAATEAAPGRRPCRRPTCRRRAASHQSKE